jgi:hypothetical protein
MPAIHYRSKYERRKTRKDLYPEVYYFTKLGLRVALHNVLDGMDVYDALGPVGKDRKDIQKAISLSKKKHRR